MFHGMLTLPLAMVLFALLAARIKQHGILPSASVQMPVASISETTGYARSAVRAWSLINRAIVLPNVVS